MSTYFKYTWSNEKNVFNDEEEIETSWNEGHLLQISETLTSEFQWYFFHSQCLFQD